MSGECENGEEIIFQSAPGFWPALRLNHHFSEFFTAHQSTSIGHLILSIVCASAPLSVAVLEKILSRPHCP